MMSFISRPSGGSTARPQTASQSLPFTSSGQIAIIENRHFVHVEPLGGMILDLALTDQSNLSQRNGMIINMRAQGRYVIDEIIMHDLRGSPGTATITIKTLSEAKGGGVTLVNAQSIASLTARHSLIRIAGPSNSIWEAPHLYITRGGTGTGSVLIRVLGRVVVPEDPENPMSDPRRLG